MKKRKENNNKSIGKLTLSATCLRSIADSLKKTYKTKGDVIVQCYVSTIGPLKTLAVKIDPKWRKIEIKKN